MAYTPLTRRVAIVNELMAAKYWPGEDPIGTRVRIFDPEAPFLEVVGVARDSKYVLIFEQPRPYFYLPIDRPISLRCSTSARTATPPRSLRSSRRRSRISRPTFPLRSCRRCSSRWRGCLDS